MKNKIAFCLLFVLFYACNQEYNSIGLSLKGNELLGYDMTDTIFISAHSTFMNSVVVRTSANNSFAQANVILGEIHDPVFGKTTAAVYTSYVLPGENSNFGSNPQLDSVVLTIPYSGFYGDTNANLRVEVFELTENIDTNATYYSHSSISHNFINLTKNQNFTYRPRPNVKFSIGGSKVDAHVRIVLDDEIGQRIIDRKPQNDNLLRDIFKGLYIVSTSNDAKGCLVNYNLNSYLSAISIYYKQKDSVNQMVYNLQTKKAPYFSVFNHEYPANFSNQLDDKRERLYMQPNCGVKTILQFPNIVESFKDKHVLIGKAELVISNVDAEEATFIAPSSLALQVILDTIVGILPDDPLTVTAGSYFGGTYDTENQEYRFRITQYIQQLILKRDTGYGINLVGRGDHTYSNRLVLGGINPLNTEKRLRLELYYTTY